MHPPLTAPPCNEYPGKVNQASLSGTDRTPSEKKNHHVPSIQMYD